MINNNDNLSNSELELEDIACHAVARGLALGADEVCVNIDIKRSNAVNVRNGEREGAAFSRTARLTVEVNCDGRQGCTYTTDLALEDIDSAVIAAVDIASYTTADPYAGLPDKEDLAWDLPDIENYFPTQVDLDVVTKDLLQLDEYARNINPLIKQSGGASFNASEYTCLIANSCGFSKTTRQTSYSQSLGLVAEKDGHLERGFSWMYTPNPNALLSKEEMAQEAMRHAIEFLDAKTIKTGNYPVILREDIAGEFIDALLTGLTGRGQYLKNSFLLDSLNTQIAPNWFTLTLDPYVKQSPYSYVMDDEGVKGIRESIIEKGVVRNYLLSSYEARKLNMTTNGHCNSLGKGYVLDTAHHIPDLASLCRMMDKGIVIADLMGSGLNSVTGDFSFGARGFWVEKGIIQYPVDGITIAGNIKNIFKERLIAIAEDFDDRNQTNIGSMLLSDLKIAGD